MAKETLNNAKKNKSDEFYTLLEDVASELCNYKRHFENKIIFCNCDDPEWSNFWKYFHQNFTEFKIKKLIATHYDSNENSSYVMEYMGGNDQDIKCWKQRHLKGDGDFRSDECVEILKEADIIVTNPPFSLFREYLSQLMEYNKKFIILGNMNALTYKEVFPLIKDNKMWIGYGFNLSMIYKTAYKNTLESNRKYVISKGYNPDEGYVKVPAIAWYTNLDIPKRHVSLVDELKYQYKKHPELYYKYDNYDAINVDKVKDIPYDYMEPIGVPITFINKYNPQEFEIIGQGQGNLYRQLTSNGLSQKFVDDYYKGGGKGSIKENHPVLGYYNGEGKAIIPYMRIIIKRRGTNLNDN